MSDFRVFKVLAAVLAVAFVVYAETQSNVLYIDASGARQTTEDGVGVTVVDASSIGSIGYLSGWYIVSGEITIDKTLSVSGTANIILEDNSSLTVTGTRNSAGIEVSNGNSLTIYAQSIGSDMGKLTATGGISSGGAGIGGISYNGKRDGGEITINGGTVTATGTGEIGSAGIGGGDSGGGGKITINGGTVTATGSGTTYGGAGIGGGGNGSGGTIIISGGTVTATGGNTSYQGDGIGRGSGYANSSSISRGTFTLNGNAVVFASNVSDTEESRRNGGILFIGNIGTFYGSSVTIGNDATIPATHTLSIPAGKALTVASGITLTNNGTITPADGSTITISGTLSGNKISGANTLPSVSDKTTTTITLGGAADLLAATGQEVEYAASTTNSTPADDWQTDLVLSGLTMGTEYYIFARSKANTNFAQGAVSQISAETIFIPACEDGYEHDESGECIPVAPPPPPPPPPPPACEDGYERDEDGECIPVAPPIQPPPITPPVTLILPQSAAINQATQIYNGISLTAKTSTTIEVYNLSGKLMNRQTYLAGCHSISFGHLPKGMYIVKALFGSEKQILLVRKP